MMNVVTLLQPQKIVFGSDCADRAAEELISGGARRVMVVTSPPLLDLLSPLRRHLDRGGVGVDVFSGIDREPTTKMYREVFEAARAIEPDAVIGFGGGSALDTAKLVATLHNSPQDLEEVFGINLVSSRTTRLVCLPTTSGTGSEVSPNALLLDEATQNKKAVVSPFLVPDAAYVDPRLTVSLPPDLTAQTGMDALIHSLEAYTNRFSHPIVDVYALESVRLIAENLVRAVSQGDDLEAREGMALGSLYGGLCLGPVNTAAVHALAYPLSGEFHVPHGLSTAVLLPYVIDFNLQAAPARYAEIAKALGVTETDCTMDTAKQGLEKLEQLLRQCGIEPRLSTLGIGEEAIPRMARGAMQVSRLLQNNPRELTIEDAETIYRAAI